MEIEKHLYTARDAFLSDGEQGRPKAGWAQAIVQGGWEEEGKRPCWDAGSQAVLERVAALQEQGLMAPRGEMGSKWGWSGQLRPAVSLKDW